MNIDTQVMPFSKPLEVEPLGRVGSAAAIAERLDGLAAPFLLESTLNVAGMGRWHLFGAGPIGSGVVWGERSRFEIGRSVREESRDPWGALEAWWRAWRSADEPDRSAAARFGIPFTGGAVGYLAYELGERIESFPVREATTGGDALPDLHLELYDECLAVDATSGEAFFCHRARAGRAARRWWEAARPSATACAEAEPTAEPREIAVSIARPEYLRAVGEIREAIGRGDVYEVNLTRRHALGGGPGPWELLRRLRGLQPVPYAALLPWTPVAVISASPERFLERVGTRVETRPIKGTAPRGATPEEDRLRGARLLASEKERAELAMIIDLERNDLGRVCIPGSIEVVEEAALERYSSVIHTVATVRGELPKECSPVTLLRAAFPGGSITGAPKIAAMQCIRRYEPVPRHVYTGSVGWIAPSGDLDLSIAIRTVWQCRGTSYFSVGGAVTWDSDPEEELAELEAKGRAIFAALGRAR